MSFSIRKDKSKASFIHNPTKEDKITDIFLPSETNQSTDKNNFNNTEDLLLITSNNLPDGEVWNNRENNNDLELVYDGKNISWKEKSNSTGGGGGGGSQNKNTFKIDQFLKKGNASITDTKLLSSALLN